MQEFRCTRNALYQHKCLGQYDLRERQGYYIQAQTSEEAWEKMASRFPQETDVGFSVDPWESFNVQVVEINSEQSDALY